MADSDEAQVLEVSLPLVQEEGANRVKMKLTIGDAEDESVAQYMGGLKVEFGINPDSRTIESIRFAGGRIWASDRIFSFGVPPVFQAVRMSGLGGYGESLGGFEELGEGGTFDATRHVVVFDRGTVETDGFFGSNLTDLSVTKMMTGSELAGRVEMRKSGDTDDDVFIVSVSLPFDTGLQELAGSSFVSYESAGGLKASGLVDFSQISESAGAAYAGNLSGEGVERGNLLQKCPTCCPRHLASVNKLKLAQEKGVRLRGHPKGAILPRRLL